MARRSFTGTFAVRLRRDQYAPAPRLKPALSVVP